MWKTTTTTSEFKNTWPRANRLKQCQEKNLATLLTAEECKEILRKFNENMESTFQYLHHKITWAKEVKGFLGEYYHLLIEVTKERHCQQKMRRQQANKEANEIDDDECENFEMENGKFVHENISILKFFIKKLPVVDEQHEKNKIFKKESLLYNTVFTELEKYAPQPWFPTLYLSTSNFLVLQDLNHLGYQSLASKENLNESEMFMVLKGLASMHATSFIYESKTHKSIEDFPLECLEEITVHPGIPWFTTGLNALMHLAKNHPNYQSERLQEFVQHHLELHLNSVFAMVNPSQCYRKVLCHRDLWSGNIFISHQGQKATAMFVDFQTCRYCPPSIDVIFTLFMNLSKEKRLEKQSDYLRYYWNNLWTFVTSELADDDWRRFSETELMESFEKFQLFGYVYRALAVTILKVPQEFVTDHYKNIERTQKLMEYMNESREFRLVMEECIADVIEAAMDYSMKK